MLADFINGNQTFIDFQPKYLSLPIFLALVPMTYHIPTLFVMGNIFWVYVRRKSNDETMNPHVFFIIVMHQFSSFLYMLSDYANIRISATGLVTSWCASLTPNHYLKLVFCLSVYFNYLTMSFPFLLGLLRLIPVYYPTDYQKKSVRLVRFFTPLILIYPLALMSFMIPALGVCRPYPAPYSFGAIYIHFQGSWREMEHWPFLLCSATIWLLLSIITNTLLYVKLQTLKHTRSKNGRLEKAEFSLTLTTASMFVAYLTNFVFLLMWGVMRPYSVYSVAMRPFGNDCDTVIVPWIFFLIHPAFRRQTRRIRNFVMPIKKVETVHVHSVHSIS